MRLWGDFGVDEVEPKITTIYNHHKMIRNSKSSFKWSVENSIWTKIFRIWRCLKIKCSLIDVKHSPACNWFNFWYIESTNFVSLKEKCFLATVACHLTSNPQKKFFTNKRHNIGSFFFSSPNTRADFDLFDQNWGYWHCNRGQGPDNKSPWQNIQAARNRYNWKITTNAYMLNW